MDVAAERHLVLLGEAGPLVLGESVPLVLGEFGGVPSALHLLPLLVLGPAG